MDCTLSLLGPPRLLDDQGQLIPVPAKTYALVAYLVLANGGTPATRSAVRRFLWENSEPHLVKAEVDVYWVKHGGEDPVARINSLGNRVLSLHLKDMAKGEDKKFAAVGTGILDFKAILTAAEKVGVQYGAVEQDNCYDVPPLESIKTSYENLKKLGAK